MWIIHPTGNTRYASITISGNNNIRNSSTKRLTRIRLVYIPDALETIDGDNNLCNNGGMINIPGAIAIRETQICRMPHWCGIYFLISDGMVCYVGQTIDLRYRLAVHVNDKPEWNTVLFLICKASQLDDLESYWVRKLNPAWNGRRPRRPPRSGVARWIYKMRTKTGRSKSSMASHAHMPCDVYGVLEKQGHIGSIRNMELIAAAHKYTLDAMLLESGWTSDEIESVTGIPAKQTERKVRDKECQLLLNIL